MSSSAATDQSDVEDAHRGNVLDERYRLDEVIGVGAIGKVYAGTQLAVERKVAIKLLHSSLRERDLSTERFLREAKAVARLSHSNCLTLFDFGSCDNLGCFYMVTEFVEGQTLASRMQHQLLPVDEVYYILYQITSALEHAHERGILHRDLKPENIMLVGQQTDYPRVKVLDFGLARIREEATQPREDGEGAGVDDSDSRITNYGELNGTPAYMSPEQCRGQLDLTPACDYYALGVLAYELFEGELPFEAPQVTEVLSMHLNDPIPSMESGRAPDDIAEMISRLLAKKPGFRLRDPADIIDRLRPYVALEPSHEFSASTLDRLRREAFEEATSPGQSDARETKRTRLDYDEVDTPIPRPDQPTVSSRETIHLDSDADSISRSSAFAEGSPLPQEKREADQVHSIRLWAAVSLAALLATLSLVGWLWLQGDEPGERTEEEADRPSAQQEGDEERAASGERGEEARDDPDEDEKDDKERDEEKASDEGDDDEKGEGVAADGEPRPAERPASPPQPRDDSSAFEDDEQPERQERDRERPRKLELDY